MDFQFEEGQAPLQLDEVGPYVAGLCTVLIPCDKGSEAYRLICKDFAEGFGTTCGFLPHFLLWAAGCRSKNLVSRSEKQDGLSYAIGKNLTRIFNGGFSPFRHFKPGTIPETGDIVYVSNGTPKTEHVFVFRGVEEEGGTTYWTSWDGGQENNSFRVRKRKLLGKMLDGRQVIGWLPLRALTYTAAPKLVVHTLPAEELQTLSDQHFAQAGSGYEDETPA